MATDRPPNKKGPAYRWQVPAPTNIYPRIAPYAMTAAMRGEECHGESFIVDNPKPSSEGISREEKTMNQNTDNVQNAANDTVDTAANPQQATTMPSSEGKWTWKRAGKIAGYTLAGCAAIIGGAYAYRHFRGGEGAPVEA